MRRRLLALILLFFLSSFGYTLYLRWFPPFTTYLILKRSMEPGLTAPQNGPPKIKATWRSYSQISDQMKLALIAAEDQRFPYHFGFDGDAMWDALKNNVGGGRIKGGSTLTQQVAKNVFLWPGRNIIRKGLEAYFSFLIEILWPKTRILEMYLNIAEMGDGVFGVEQAARRYYHVGAHQLTASQAAGLAAILPNPRRWSPAAATGEVPGRKARIQRNMRRLGMGYLRQIE